MSRSKCTFCCVLLLFSGCAYEDYTHLANFEKKPNQDKVVNFIWDFYNSKTPVNSPPPQLGWIEYTDCGSDYPGFMDYGECVTGSTWLPDYKMFIWDSMTIQGYTWSETALAHEMCHAFKWKATGDADGQHISDCFTDRGLVNVVTSQMNANGYSKL